MTAIGILKGIPELVNPHLLKNEAFIGGRWIRSSTGRSYPVINPANQEMISDVADLSASEVELTVQAAKDAMMTWSLMIAKERSIILQKWKSLIVKHHEELSRIITLEMGKPLSEARGEVTYGNSFLEWFAEEGKRVYGDVIPTTAGNRRLLVMKQPAGVCSLITPWNFPVAMLLRKAGAALAAGCTVVVKPSEETPFAALALAELASEAGLPEGVFNVVTCSRDQVAEVGRTLCTSPDVAKISLTGSTTAGKTVMKLAAEGIKKVSLELGGNAPLIVFNSADIKVAVASTVAAKFRNSGQTCICPNRIFVQDKVHDQFVEELSKVVSSLKVGDGFTEGVQQGPLINEMAIEKVSRHVRDACEKGATVVVGGEVASDVGKWFYQPTVLTDVKQNMLFTCEETFGPVAAITRFSEEEEVLKLSNDTAYGLSGYFFSNDYRQVWRVAEALQIGLVGVNEGAISTEVVPFGGWKESGFGSEGSKYGIEEYLNTKYVCMGNL
jgi:succinate-semialdehyde dehydrogenase/glutarate-semialdehyde dehydrogenase